MSSYEVVCFISYSLFSAGVKGDDFLNLLKKF